MLTLVIFAIFSSLWQNRLGIDPKRVCELEVYRGLARTGNILQDVRVSSMASYTMESLVMDQFRRIPRIGKSVEHSKLRITVQELFEHTASFVRTF